MMTARPLLLADLHFAGDHEGSWRLPGSAIDRISDPDYFVELASTVARAGMHGVFLPDFVAVDPLIRSVLRWPYEPTTLAAAIAAQVPDLSVFVTASTVYSAPDQLYRTFSTLSEISGGRIGWNIVTTGSPHSAQSIGFSEAPSHDTRYQQAHSTVESLLTRWGSRRPTLAQAGASPAGRAFAARHADVVFTAAPTLEQARAFRADIRRRAREFGRDPDEIRVLPGILTVIGATRAEASALHRELGALVSEHAATHMLAMYGVELPSAGLDSPLRAVELSDGHDGIRSRAAILARIAHTLGPKPTWRDLVSSIAGSRGHLAVTGTGSDIASVMNTWLNAGACDGFVVKFAHSPGGAIDFAQSVAPHVVGHRPVASASR